MVEERKYSMHVRADKAFQWRRGRGGVDLSTSDVVIDANIETLKIPRLERLVGEDVDSEILKNAVRDRIPRPKAQYPPSHILA